MVTHSSVSSIQLAMIRQPCLLRSCHFSGSIWNPGRLRSYRSSQSPPVAFSCHTLMTVPYGTLQKSSGCMVLYHSDLLSFFGRWYALAYALIVISLISPCSSRVISVVGKPNDHRNSLPVPSSSIKVAMDLTSSLLNFGSYAMICRISSLVSRPFVATSSWSPLDCKLKRPCKYGRRVSILPIEDL